jgi:Glycosyl hydrolase catalytic core
MLAHDKVTVHWYPDGPRLGRYLEQVHRMAGQREVWLTETGKGTCNDRDQVKAFKRALEEFVKDDRTWWSKVFFYVLHNDKPCSEAILRPDWQPRPAFDYYRAFIAAHP